MMLTPTIIHAAAILVLIVHVSGVRKRPDDATRSCELYNETLCKDHGQGCFERKTCDGTADKRNHCFVLWHHDNDTGRDTIKMKGCFLNNDACHNKTECVARTEPNKNLMFCCCDTDMCNRNYSWDPLPTQAPRLNLRDLNHVDLSRGVNQITLVIYVVLATIMVSGVGVIAYWFYNQRNQSLFMEVPTMDGQQTPDPPSCLDAQPIKLIEIKARGRFGAVWKALFKNEEVAVKIFPAQDKQSWLSEQEIYQLPRMNHPNILRFIGGEKRPDTNEYWLVTAYHERGSLCDYLKANTLTWPQLCRIAESMACGLMHLHEETPSKKASGYKPAIAHRDFKSKNVLLKADMTACVADFGLALIFEPGKPCGDTHGQVGTRRYMAPEVLEGAINFTLDSFLRIDMYACGLVLWELASRCTGINEYTVKDYSLPFEEEVGAHPSLEEMQEYVVQRKVRPCIPNEWRQHAGMTMLCNTMEECWDHDAEARLSASCVMERIITQCRFSTSILMWEQQSNKVGNLY